MAFPKMADIKDLSDEEVVIEIAATRRRLFDLRFQKATRQLEKGLHQFKQERHKLAQLMTLQQQRKSEIQTNDGAAVANDASDN
ncbi:MAG: 50S ribosomal protein L29 [Cyanobacteria bacterium]|nr:50S ribosomal protein L29 [Cyanobacteriota bacterium]